MMFLQIHPGLGLFANGGRFAKSLGHQDNQLSEISAVLLSPALRSIKLATGLKLLKFQPGCLGFGDDIPYPMWGL